MRETLLIGLIIFFSCNPRKSYSQSDEGHTRFDSISYKDIGVSGVGLGENVSRAYDVLGHPDSVKSVTDEFQGVSYNRIYYGLSNLNVENDQVTGFNIQDRSLIFDYNSIRVGDSTTFLQELFPNSYYSKYRTDEEEIVKVRINGSDDYILFKINNTIIVNILTWEDQ